VDNCLGLSFPHEVVKRGTAAVNGGVDIDIFLVGGHFHSGLEGGAGHVIAIANNWMRVGA